MPSSLSAPSPTLWGASGGLGIDDPPRPLALGPVQQLRAVSGKCETIRAIQQHFVFAFFQIVGVNRGGFSGERSRQSLNRRRRVVDRVFGSVQAANHRRWNGQGYEI